MNTEPLTSIVRLILSDDSTRGNNNKYNNKTAWTEWIPLQSCNIHTHGRTCMYRTAQYYIPLCLLAAG